VIGELYFGDAFGFLESGSDYGNYIATLDVLLPLLGVSAVLSPALRVPWMLFGLLRGEVRRGITCMQSIEELAKAQVDKRSRLLRSSEKTNLRRDLLAKLFDVHEAKGESHDFRVPDIEQEGYVGIFAGSDTTAIAMRSIVDNLLRHPEALAKLQAELDNAFTNGQLSLPIRYAQASKLPFFAACVKEGMRLHPSVGLHLPRIFPEGGCQLAGHYFPAGSRVGVNPTVIHRNTAVFGEDANQFKPERWLNEARISDMEVSCFADI
jgi:cytochrome P450